MTPNVPPALAHTVMGSGDRVVLVHGFTQSGRSWDRIARSLARHHEVCVVDLPGHGGSTTITVPDLESSARLVGDVGGHATYVGYSLGGRIALTLAHHSPDLVDRLVLVGATPGISDDAERAARRAADDHLADRLDPPSGPGIDLDDFLDDWLAQPLFAHLSSEQADRASRVVNSPTGLAQSLRTNGTGTQIPTFDVLGSLTMPVLLAVGERDEKFTAIARQIAERIGENAAVSVVGGSGHAVPFEQPERFLAVLEAWLGSRR